MNCEQFDDLLPDLARETGPDHTGRPDALAHAETCPTCQGRLQGQKDLTVLFKAAASDYSGAPAHLKDKLLSAYRSRGETKSRISSRTSAMNIRFGYLRLAAALLVALLGVATYRVLHSPRSIPVAEGVPVLVSPGSPQPARTGPVAGDAGQTVVPVQVAAALPAAGKKATPRRPASKAQPAESEIATDFFPLASRADIAAMESGQIVRVLLPRNAMAAYGLPVNQERIDEPVSAQVLIGQDGVARAIRFLSSQNTNYVPAGMRSKR